MKKFLTVLLVIAVMFTFSFNTAFAAGAEYTYAQASELVSKTVNELLTASQDAKKAALSAFDKNTTVHPDGGEVVVVPKEAAELVFAEMYDAYYRELTNEAKVQQQALAAAYKADNNVRFTDGGEVLNTTRLTGKEKPVYANYNFGETEEKLLNTLQKTFTVVQANQKAAVETIDLSKYSTNEYKSGKSYRDVASELVSQALNQIDGYDIKGKDKVVISNYINYMLSIYTVPVGTADATGALATGATIDTINYTPGLNNLKTEAIVLTDEAKIAYAKKAALANVERVIKAEKDSLIAAQEKEIFKQEVSTTPDQNAIKNAKKEIAQITKKYDALLTVMKYRIENAYYTVVTAHGNATKEFIYANYNGELYKAIWSNNHAIAEFNSNVLANARLCSDSLSVNKLGATPENALVLVEHVAKLEEQATLLKAKVDVDGDYALAVDKALAAAIEETYMLSSTSNKVVVDKYNYELHNRAHSLVGDTCDKQSIVEGKVKVDGKEYDTVLVWKSDANKAKYDAKKFSEVKAIANAAIKEIRAAKSIADADAAFLAAYKKYDEVMTKAEHEALFLYGGALYKAYPDACAEIDAYIDYKVGRMVAGTNPDTKNTVGDMAELKAYYKGIFKTKVYSTEDLAAKLAEAKETVDTLKKKTDLEAEEAALYAEVLKVKDPVQLDAKDSIVELYRKVMAFEDYAEMVGFSTIGYAKSRIEVAASQLATLEDKAIEELIEKIQEDGSDAKLSDKKDVEAYLAAINAYNDLYVYDLEVDGVVELVDTNDFEDDIFKAEVYEVEKLIAALPVNASAAKVAEARKAVEALGYRGICAVDAEYLTKLNKFDYDASYAVKSMKLRAYSKYAKKGITVKWVIEDGRKSDAKGYQVWRSTKANSGYKKLITVNPSYGVVNAKNLKKGVTYYYKVRAYNRTEDGKLIFSDWSNKAYRKAK